MSACSPAWEISRQARLQLLNEGPQPIVGCLLDLTRIDGGGYTNQRAVRTIFEYSIRKQKPLRNILVGNRPTPLNKPIVDDLFGPIPFDHGAIERKQQFRDIICVDGTVKPSDLPTSSRHAHNWRMWRNT